MTISGLDELDRQLLKVLQADDRLSVAEIGKQLAVPASTLNDRIRRLIRMGVITGFHAHVAAEKVGLDLLAFVFVGWSDAKTEAEFLRRMAESPQVLECHHITGAWNYMLKVRLARTRDLEAFLARVIKDVPGVQRTETMIVMSSSKETTAVVPPDGRQ